MKTKLGIRSTPRRNARPEDVTRVIMRDMKVMGTMTGRITVKGKSLTDKERANTAIRMIEGRTRR